MSVGYSTNNANAYLDASYDIYNAKNLRLYTGAKPADADTAPTGTLIANIVLPNPAFQAAATRAKVKSASAWTVAAAASGTMGYYELVDTVTSKREYGTITIAGGGGDMITDNVSVNSGQVVTVTTFTKTMPAT
jgi:hypothetical protein